MHSAHTQGLWLTFTFLTLPNYGKIIVSVSALNALSHAVPSLYCSHNGYQYFQFNVFHNVDEKNRLVSLPGGVILTQRRDSSHHIPRPVDDVEDEEHQRKDSARDDLDHQRLVAGELVPPGRQPTRHSERHAGDRQRRRRTLLRVFAGRRRTLVADMTPAAIRLRRR